MLAVAGENYVICASDTRMSTGYSILTRNYEKVDQMSPKTLMASAGFMADAQTLKKTFAVYDIRITAAAEGRKVSNWEVAKLTKLDYRQRDKGLDVYDETAVKRVVSAIVARHMKDAKSMIENAAFGTFP